MGISTHILDTTQGRPAVGVSVVLADGTGEVARGVTDADGRVRLVQATPAPGSYRLIFAVGPYLGPEAFYPEVTVAFVVRAGAGDHYHVPLLLNPFGYATYRGS